MTSVAGGDYSIRVYLFDESDKVWGNTYDMTVTVE